MINEDGTEGDMSLPVNNYCISCHKGIRAWFHGQGFICDTCHEKGITRENLGFRIEDITLTSHTGLPPVNPRVEDITPTTYN